MVRSLYQFVYLIAILIIKSFCFDSCKKQMKTTKKYEVNEFAISVKPKENDDDSLELKITNEGKYLVFNAKSTQQMKIYAWQI